MMEILYVVGNGKFYIILSSFARVWIYIRHANPVNTLYLQNPLIGNHYKNTLFYFIKFITRG